MLRFHASRGLRGGHGGAPVSDLQRAAALTREIMGLPQPVVAAEEQTECELCGGDPRFCGEKDRLNALRDEYYDRKEHMARDEGWI